MLEHIAKGAPINQGTFMLSSFLASAMALSAQSADFDAEALLAAQDETVVARLATCDIDTEAFTRLMTLSQQDFDQDFDGGWRPYGDREDCAYATGELIELYRDHAPGVEPDGLQILNWHAGQMYAYAEARARAIPLFTAAKDNDGQAWDLYADVTIAFLQGDRGSAEAAREALLAFAPDEAEQAARQRFLDENPSIRMPDGFVTDPPNLGPVDRLLGCWEGGYREAYSGQCEEAAEASPVGLSLTPRACGFVTERIRSFETGATEGGMARVSAAWLAAPGDRDMLVSFLNQDGRERGSGAPFGMAYSEDFATAIETLDDAAIDQLFANITTPGRVDDEASCAGRFDATREPFTEDIATVIAWAGDQASNPGDDAPTALETLSLSRPTFFDDGSRVIFVEQHSLTPITLSRPPSALMGFSVYRWQNDRWEREAGILLSRSG